MTSAQAEAKKAEDEERFEVYNELALMENVSKSDDQFLTAQSGASYTVAKVKNLDVSDD